ncbi:MAG TPA: hypothetical protein VM325_09755 [Alphaproteobacteria bacterium]|nr:hypothetical protein [Alphaproteobacteria bacterium]
MTAEARKTADEVLCEIAPHCPTDFVVRAFEGDRLTLHGGSDSSGWVDLEIVFDDVLYMALPVYLSSVSVRMADDAARAELITLCNCDPANDTFHVFELVEDEDWPEGRKFHRVAAEAIRFRAPVPQDTV